MPTPVQMPKIGLTMTEGTIVEWKKGEGDPVEKGEILFVFETEKVAIEVQAPESGILHKIHYPEGATVKVSEVVAVIVAPGEEGVDVRPAAKTEGPPEPRPAAEEATTDFSGKEQKRPRATPVARKLARLHHLDLSRVRGSGPQGRVLKNDVEAFLENDRAFGSDAAPPPAGVEAETVRPVTGMRRIIASKMLASTREAAQAYMDNDLDASRLLALRKAILPDLERESGLKPTITDILMFIAAAAIRRHPVVNTRWEQDEVRYFSHIHMGMAMMLEEGLIVPVIRNIENKSIGDIARCRKDLVERGRQGKMTPDEMKGSTFTLSSMGMLGIQRFTAIINQPESAILAAGAIVDRPAVVDGRIEVRPMMNLALTYDHRIIDGAEAAKFMASLKKMVENPVYLFAAESA